MVSSFQAVLRFLMDSMRLEKFDCVNMQSKHEKTQLPTNLCVTCKAYTIETFIHSTSTFKEHFIQKFTIGSWNN